MIKIENFEVVGMEHAIRGMRNPMNSWNKSDTMLCRDMQNCDRCSLTTEECSKLHEGFRSTVVVGEKDHKLMSDLSGGGSVHAKYRRMIVVYTDITAPLYWWKEFDTYKVGTVANSCSTMHKIHDKEFTLEDFSYEHLSGEFRGHMRTTIKLLNIAREAYNECNTDAKKDWWWQMIQLLPSSYNQKRTIMLNYEVLTGIYKFRKDHKLDEWREFCKWIEQLPYSEIITGPNEREDE